MDAMEDWPLKEGEQKPVDVAVLVNIIDIVNTCAPNFV